jgi:hypothetical protein
VRVPVADRKPPPWKKAPTVREADEMRAWVEKTLTALIDHDAQAAYQDSLRALGQLSRCPPQEQDDLYAKWLADFRLREARYGNLEPLRKGLRKRIPGAEEWIKEPPRNRGQPRPQRERDERNARLLLALRFVNRFQTCFPPGHWPRAIVVEVVAAHYEFSVGEVEKALHRGVKEFENALRHLTGTRP